MSEPTPRHVFALGSVIWTTSRADERTISAIGANAVATALLTSTEPAVLDAMQDALVRAGRLTMSWHEWGVQRPEPFEGVMQSSPPMHRNEAAALAESASAIHEGHWRVVSRWRFYTPWRSDDA